MNRALFSIITLGFVLLLSQISWAAGPALNFSDITSGPKTGIGDGLGSGVIVTVWGNNLGSSQGTSKVYVGNVEAAYVYYWGNATSQPGHPADLYTYHKMQVIMFSVPATAVDGANNIKVNVGGVDSNTLPFTVRAGRIFHVKSNGNDSNSGTWSNPWLTMDKVGGNQYTMQAGDTVYFGDGEGISGTWGFTLWNISGSNNNHIAYIAYPGATVTVQATSGAIANHSAASHHFVISKFRLLSDGDGIQAGSYSRFVGNEITDITCANGQGGALVSDHYSEGDVYFGEYVHDFGGACTSSLHHTTYFTKRDGGAPKVPFEIGWSLFKDNMARGGFHIFEEHTCYGYSGIVRIHDNVMMNEMSDCLDVNGAGCYTGSSMSGSLWFYNNVLSKCGQRGANPSVDGTSPSILVFGYANLMDVKIFNNTLYDYSYSGCSNGDNVCEAVFVPGNNWNTAWNFGGTWSYQNNIVYATNNSWFGNNNGFTKAPAVSNHNLWYSTYGQTIPTWDSSPLTSDPRFVGGSPYSLNIQSGSPARNAGTISLGAAIRKDVVGTLRKTTPKAPSIGAYEYDDGSASPLSPSPQ